MSGPGESERLDYPDQLWRHLTQHHALKGQPARTIVKGEDCYLTDDAGNTFLDCLAGLWCVNIGYGRKEMAQAAAGQMEQLSYLAPFMANEPAIKFAAEIQRLLGQEVHTWFSSSGSEANETAFKIARQYHLQSGTSSGAQRYKIISRYRAYHGSTLGAMAATGQAERKLGYGPEPGGFVKVMGPYPYRAPEGMSVEEHGEQCAHWLEEAIIHEGVNSVAAFITEPMVSGGGVIVPPDNYLPRVREICDRYGVLLILDEVVSGFGRLGTMFGHQHWDVQADIYTFAKGLASGYQPIAATTVRAELFERFADPQDALSHLRHINTFGAHPVAAAAGLCNLEILQREDLTANGAMIGQHLRDRFSDRFGDHPNVGQIRGLGLLNGIELVSDRTTMQPMDDQQMMTVIGRCMQNGILLGRNGNTVPGRCNVLVMAPPLTLCMKDADRVIDCIDDVLTNIA